MIVTLIRTLIIFITLLIIMRLMGKRQIGEMQPFEFIVTLIIADLACIPMADMTIPLLYGIVAIFGLFLMHQLLSLLERTGDKVKFAISGKPSVVINKNGVDLVELKKNNMDVEDLIESMRSAGYFSLDDLDYAIFESNGKLSALENKNCTEKANSIPVLLVSGGKTIDKNLSALSVTNADISSFLSGQGTTLKNTDVLTVDGNGRAYLKNKNERYKISLCLSWAQCSSAQSSASSLTSLIAN